MERGYEHSRMAYLLFFLDGPDGDGSNDSWKCVVVSVWAVFLVFLGERKNEKRREEKYLNDLLQRTKAL